MAKSDPRSKKILGRFFLFLIFLTITALPIDAGPLSERVLLVAPRSGIDKIYICRPDGKDLRRFCKEAGSQNEPAYSQTLQRVFFVRQVKRQSQICSVNLKGRDFKVELSLRANVRHPDPSPDGTKLALSTDLWGAFEVAELNLETRKLKRVTYNQGINTHPQYSPDGSQLLFLGRRHGGSQIYLWTLETKALEQLTESAFNKGIPAWKPDGTRIVATESLPPQLVRSLFELDLQTRKKRFLLPKSRNANDPTYSPDGSQIIFLEQNTLFTFDPADTQAEPFPIRGQLEPKEAIWVKFPLP